MINIDSSAVTLESLLQIYTNIAGKPAVIKRINNNDMYLNKKKLIKLMKDSSPSAMKMVSYCILSMETKDEVFETMSIELDYTNEECRSLITKDKKSFYDAIKELTESKFLMKWKPKVYLVDHRYISCLTPDQANSLTRHKYQLIQSATPGTWINDLINPNE